MTHSFGFGDSKETPTTLAREACEASEACEAEITSWNILSLDPTLSQKWLLPPYVADAVDSIAGNPTSHHAGWNEWSKSL